MTLQNTDLQNSAAEDAPDIEPLSDEEIAQIEALSGPGYDDSGESDLWKGFDPDRPESGTPQAAAETESAELPDAADGGDYGGQAQGREKLLVWDRPNQEEEKKVRAESLKQFGTTGNFGLFLIIALIFGYVIGRGMDSLFGTKPVFTVFWVVCAVIASIMELVKSIKAGKALGEDHGEEK